MCDINDGVDPVAAIVVCAYNDQDYIEDVVRAVTEQELDGKEVVVVDDCSTDDTLRILETIPDIKLIHNQENMGLAASLTAGFAATTAPIVFSLHSDCLLRDRRWMAKMIEPFVDPTIGAVVSRRLYPPRAVLPLGARLFDAVCPQRLNPDTTALTDLEFFRDKADAYRRDVIERLGGWDPAFFTAGEDTDLSIKMRAAGYRIVLHPHAAVEYIFSSRQKTIWGGVKKAILYGRTAVPLYKRHRYDGLQTRSYLWCLLGILAAALPLFWRLPVSALLLLTSFNRTFMFHRLRRRVPLAAFLAASAAALAPVAAATGRSAGLTLMSYAVPLGCLSFVAIIALKNSIRSLRQGEAPHLLPLLLGYSIIWHLGSGVGYLGGYARLLVRRKN